LFASSSPSTCRVSSITRVREPAGLLRIAPVEVGELVKRDSLLVDAGDDIGHPVLVRREI
jgi:hypothetical protein